MNKEEIKKARAAQKIRDKEFLDNTCEGMNKINGKYYPLWSQFVDKKSQFIGGILIEKGENETYITNITLEPNGDDSAMFSVEGKDYSCGFDVQYGGIKGEKSPGVHMLSTFGLEFSVYKKKESHDSNSRGRLKE